MGAPAEAGRGVDPHRTMFLYWGRRGGLSRFACDLWRAAQAERRLDPSISISRQNERFRDFSDAGARLFEVDTFGRSAGALLRLPSVPRLKRELRDRLRRERIETVVTLLAHVWTPLVTPVFRDLGVRTVTIVHDADPHPGDRSGLLQSWYQRDLLHADRLVTLSHAVTNRLVKAHGVAPSKILTLFHPDFGADGGSGRALARRPDEPFRLLFLGRILPYKGLALLVEAVRRLRAEGRAVTLGVFGEGDLAPYAAGLKAVEAEVVNRWLTDGEIDAALSRHHALVLSHVEASQSGVAALALGHGLPIVARRVGGLEEQIRDGSTGVLADGDGAEGLGHAIARLMDDPDLRERIVTAMGKGRGERSMRAFMTALAADLVQEPRPTEGT